MIGIDRAELPLVALAVVVVIVPRAGRPPEWISWSLLPLIGLLLIVALWRRSRSALALVMILLVVTRCGAQLDSLRRPVALGTVSGRARLVTDPAQRDFDVQAIVSINGRRYVASMPSAAATQFRSMQVGQTMTLRGTPRPFDGAPIGWVLSNHLVGRFAVESVADPAPAPPWYRLANGIRSLITRSGSSMSPDDRALYLGLVVGDDRSQSELQKYRFKASGLSHLLAVSGQNVAFVLAIASPLTRRLGPRRSLFIAIPVLIVFALVTRAEPSVLRAVTMASVALVAVATDRQVQGIRVLSLTVIGLVVIDPLIVHSMAFTLSVSATLGLIVLTQPISSWLRGPPWLTEPLAVTVAAQLATAPVLYTMTDSLPSVATPANLLAVPVSGFVMMAGLTAGLLAGSVRSDVAGVLMWPIELMVRWVDWVARTASRLPLAQLAPLRMLVLAAVLVGVVVASRRIGSRDTDGVLIWRWATRLLGVIAVVGLVIPPRVGVDLIDIGDEARFTRTPCGRSVVTLTKGARGIEVLESLDALGISSVDIVTADGSRSAQRAASYVSEQHRSAQVVEVGDIAVGSDQSLFEAC